MSIHANFTMKYIITMTIENQKLEYTIEKITSLSAVQEVLYSWGKRKRFIDEERRNYNTYIWEKIGNISKCY